MSCKLIISNIVKIIGFTDSTYPVENENNCYETTQEEKFADDEILSKEKNQLNIEGKNFFENC